METKDIPVDNISDDNKKEEIAMDNSNSKVVEKKQDDEIEVKIEVLETKEEEKEQLMEKNSEQEEKAEPKKENKNIHNIQNDTRDASKKEDIQKHKVVFILSYLGILFFLPLVVCPESKLGRFHANQGIVLFLAGIGGEIVQIILEILLPISFLGFISFIFNIYGLALFVLMIIGMINASKGEEKPLPVIGGIQIIK